jgi:alpha,alpha-trehalase
MRRREFVKSTVLGLSLGSALIKGRVSEASPGSDKTSMGEWFLSRREELEKVREFIKIETRKLIDMQIKTPKFKGPQLPHPYIPVHEAPKWRYVFYWDMYFTIRQLLEDGHIEVAKNQIKNFLYLFDKYGYVPNANVYAWASRSQPPLLTSMVRLLNEHENDPDFQKQCYHVCKKEYEDVWLGPLHLVKEFGLSRYQDTGFGTARLLGGLENPISQKAAEAESGWDFTPRFDDRCLKFLPVDLNAFLYKYEVDLAWMAEELSMGKDEVELWRSRAEERKFGFNDIFWDPEKNFYFDYDFKNRKPGKVWSLAGYIPLWAGLADEERVKGAVKALPKFDMPHGLAVCDQDYGYRNRQWNFPNAWPPLTWWVSESMRAHGFKSESNLINIKYLEAQTKLFQETGAVWEKYNAVTGGLDVTGGHEFGSNPMLGWSGSTFTDFYETAKKEAKS